MKKFYKKFDSKLELFEALAPLTDKLDFDAMIEALPRSHREKTVLITPEGGRKVAWKAKTLFAGIFSYTGLPILYPICFQRGNTLHVYTKEDIFGTEAAKEVLKELPEATEAIEQEVVVVAAVGAEETKVVEFSRTYADSLYDGDDAKGSKDALEDYGKLFGIDLKKNKSFSNMLKSLEAHVNK